MVTELKHTRPRNYSQYSALAQQIEAEQLEIIGGGQDPEIKDLPNIPSSMAQKLMGFLETQDKTINQLCDSQEASLKRKMGELNKIKVEYDEN